MSLNASVIWSWPIYTWKGTLPSDEPRSVQEHEEGVTDVVVDVRHDVEEDQETPEKVVLDMIGHADQLNFVHHGGGRATPETNRTNFCTYYRHFALWQSSQLMSCAITLAFITFGGVTPGED